MRKIIIIILVIAIIALVVGAYFLIAPKNNSAPGTSSTGQPGTLPAPIGASSTSGSPSSGAPGANGAATLPDYIGTVSEVYGTNIPSGATLSIGTTQGTVQVNNFYAANPSVVEGGVIVIKQTSSYALTYDPSTSEFWLAITGTPFATWQTSAEADFLETLGINEADACKLNVTSGVVYAPGNPLDGQDFPLTFCSSNGAFSGK
jgi:hypothetical protein